MRDRGEMDTVEYVPLGVREAQPAATPGPVVRVDYAARSHVGKVRPNNEDQFLVAKICRSLQVLTTSLPESESPRLVEDEGYCLVVADGMGGMAAGEEASMLAIRTGLKLVLESNKWCLKIEGNEAEELTRRMRAYFQEVDRTIIERSKTDHSLAGMATTLTVAYSVGEYAFIVHAGDSRAYLFHDGELRQLTRDHTMAQTLVNSGWIKPEDVKSHPGRHVITNCAGGLAPGIQPELTTLRLADGDCLLLCSDGLTEMVDGPTITQTLRTHAGADDARRALVELALDHGGRDNVTVVVARYTIGGERP